MATLCVFDIVVMNFDYEDRREFKFKIQKGFSRGLCQIQLAKKNRKNHFVFMSL
jgi:hypothetical protein